MTAAVPYAVAIPHWLQRTAVQRAVFYLGLPLAQALVFTLMHSGLAAVLPPAQGLLFWSLVMLPGWWACQGFSALFHLVLRPWTPPLWAICVLGKLGQAVVLSPAYRAYHHWAQATLATSGHVDENWPLPAFTLEYLVVLAWTILPGSVIWIAANYVYDRVLDVPRFRYGAPAPRVPGQSASDEARPLAQQPPAMLRQSRLPATAEIRAITAEEHYVRIYSDEGVDLVRYRFSDALEELAGVAGGMQVHRSWWVRIDRATRWHARGRLIELELEQGLRVPISFAFREAVLAHAPDDVRSRVRRGAQRRQGKIG